MEVSPGSVMAYKSILGIQTRALKNDNVWKTN
jgi:hypothetical protein